MEMRRTAPVGGLPGSQPVSRHEQSTAAAQARRGAAAEVAQAAAAKPAVTQQPAPTVGAARAPGATAVFTARQAQLNTDVTGTQRALAFVDTAAGQLRGLKRELSAMLGTGTRGSDAAAQRIARFDALWSQRASSTGGVLDAQLGVHPSADATRTFRVRALDAEQWRSNGPETLTFHPMGLGKQAASITFDSTRLEPAAFAKRLDRALAATGVRASLAPDGQVDFTVAESRWPTVRDQLMMQGGGKRFPGGRPSRAHADAAPEAIEPARWQVQDRTAQRATLRDVVRALDGLAQADRTLRTHLDAASGRLHRGLGEAAGPQAIRATRSVADTLGGSQDFNVLSTVTATLSGLSRARVETLLKL